MPTLPPARNEVIANFGIPVIVAPNGTIATNGVVTVGTALPTTYSGGAWVRFPAGAVVAGSAGLYYTVFSSTTVGQVYTNFSDASTAFTPSIPTSLVAATGSNAGYTQGVGSDFNLANITVAGGLMGANGMLRPSYYIQTNNSAGNKISKCAFSTIAMCTITTTTSIGTRIQPYLLNAGSMALQKSPLATSGTAGIGLTSGTASAMTYSTIDTSTAQQLVLTGQIATATDYIILESLTIEVLKA